MEVKFDKFIGCVLIICGILNLIIGDKSMAICFSITGIIFLATKYNYI